MAGPVAVPLEWEEAVPARRPLWRRLLQLGRRHPLGLFGFLLLVTFLVVAIFADVIAPYDPVSSPSCKEIEGETVCPTLIAPTLSGHFGAHPFGTDRLGRDVLSRVIVGARASLVVSAIATVLGVLAATAFGIVSGYLGGRVDNLIQRANDVLLAFPALVLVLAIISVLGNEESDFRQFLVRSTPIPEGSFLGIPRFLDAFVIALAISIAIFATVLRIIRGAVLSQKENVYIEAARALGASDLRIMARHILPNILTLVIVLASILLPVGILTEAALDFLGLGLPEPIPSWGRDLSGRNREAAIAGFWWPAFFPGLALSLTVLGFNMVGDALRDILDPRLRGGPPAGRAV